MHTRRRVDFLCTCQQRLLIVRSLGENTMSTPPGKRRRKICNEPRGCVPGRKKGGGYRPNISLSGVRVHAHRHTHTATAKLEKNPSASRKKHVTVRCAKHEIEKVKRLKKKNRSEKDGQVGAVRDSDAATARSIPPSSGGYQCTTQSRFTNPQRARWRLRKSGVTNKNNTRLFSFRRTDAIRACATGTLCLAAAAAIVISQTTTNPAQKL